MTCTPQDFYSLAFGQNTRSKLVK